MWQEENNRLKKEFKFKNFTQAFSFMTEVAFAAEKSNHHPDWHNSWNKVSIELTTHSAGNTITDKDKKLASEIDGIAERFPKP